MNNFEKARSAFERALKLDPSHIESIVAVAIMELNKNKIENIKTGVRFLSKAYTLDNRNPMVLNNLANHFFYKKEYSKATQLAMYAYHNAENEDIRAESCYHIARLHHVQVEYDQAFQFYYQSNQYCKSNNSYPLFGLAQMYIARSDENNAIILLEKYIEKNPTSIEAMKTLAFLYRKAGVKNKEKTIENYLQNVISSNPNDIDSLIVFAEISQSDNNQNALHLYMKAVSFFDAHNKNVPCELYNNIASCYYKLENYCTSELYYKKALKCCEDILENQNINQINSETLANTTMIKTTILFNIGRLNETMKNYETSEKIYKEILRNDYTYLDAYLRLGCMARDKGLYFDASDWFKLASKITPNNADLQLLIANMHMSKNELGPCQKKLEKILATVPLDNDPYTLCALGNIWLTTLYASNNNDERNLRHQNRAIAIFKQVLASDSRNVYAANGIGCVLAQMSHFKEAREIFAIVRDATPNVANVWINLAHIYVEQQQYMNAILMYENCIIKFFGGKNQNQNPDLYQYLARAYYKSGNFKRSREILIKIRHMVPYSKQIIFNLCLVVQKIAQKTFHNDNCFIQEVNNAIEELKVAKQLFEYVCDYQEKQKFDNRRVTREIQHCSDLLKQSSNYIARCQKREEEEKMKSQKYLEELEKIRLQTEREESEKLDKEKARINELAQKRTRYLEEMEKKAVTNIGNDEELLKVKRSKNKNNEDFLNDNELEESPASSKKIVSSKKRGRKPKNRQISDDKNTNEDNKKRRIIEQSSDESDSNPENDHLKEALYTNNEKEPNDDC